METDRNGRGTRTIRGIQDINGKIITYTAII